mgnify:CR=1 FL=1
MGSSSEASKRLSGAASGWIAAADGKAAALLGVSNILLGAVFLADLEPGPAWVDVLRVGFIAVVLIQHIVVAAFVLWPRTNRAKLLKEAGFPSALDRSPSFFGDVAKLKHAELVTLMDDDAAQDADKLEQAFILAVIADRKMVAYQWALGLFIVGLVAFCLLAVVELFCHAAG